MHPQIPLVFIVFYELAHFFSGFGPPKRVLCDNVFRYSSQGPLGILFGGPGGLLGRPWSPPGGGCWQQLFNNWVGGWPWGGVRGGVNPSPGTQFLGLGLNEVLRAGGLHASTHKGSADYYNNPKKYYNNPNNYCKNHNNYCKNPNSYYKNPNNYCRKII